MIIEFLLTASGCASAPVGGTCYSHTGTGTGGCSDHLVCAVAPLLQSTRCLCRSRFIIRIIGSRILIVGYFNVEDYFRAYVLCTVPFD